MDVGLERGDRAVVVFPNGPEFFTAFYGVQRVGGVAVPLFPGSGVGRIFAIASSCEARVVVLPGSIPEGRLGEFRSFEANADCCVVTVPEAEKAALEVDFPPVYPDDIAFIQYTSGSTGNPKGVQLSHANLLTNMKQMIAGMEISAQDIFVSWLPVYHDMGLILKTMIPFYLAVELHLLPTNLKNVHVWLNTLHQRRATFTAAPDFAYRLCVRYTEDPSRYDLTCIRVALNAAEPVRNQTIRDFEGTFGIKNVMVAGYGLAEATVGVSMWPPGKPAKVDRHGFVSVGSGFPEVELKILKDGKVLSQGEVSEIAIRSPANTRGYFNNPAETERLFWKKEFMLSGDLGYIDPAGDLFIVGRVKNIIKHAGETISPQEVEEIVDRQPAVRFSAAAGIDRGRLEGEQVYVFAEIRDGETKCVDELQEISMNIVSDFYHVMGFRPGRVYLLKPHSIPQTHNGKIQYTRLKENYLNGKLRTEGKILFPDY